MVNWKIQILSVTNIDNTMYYNSSTGKVKCVAIQNATWEACIDQSIINQKRSGEQKVIRKCS